MAPELEAAEKGTLAGALARHVGDKSFARSAAGVGSICYTDPANLTDEAIDCYFEPLVSSARRRAQLHEYVLSFEPNPLPSIESALRKVQVPARMIWATGDQFFDLSWAGWLNRILPQSRGVRRVEGAKVFFPEEMPSLIADEALFLWDGVSPDQNTLRNVKFSRTDPSAHVLLSSAAIRRDRRTERGLPTRRRPRSRAAACELGRSVLSSP